MCGRFTLRDPAKAYEMYLRGQAIQAPAGRFNIAPGQKVAAVRAGSEGRREIEEFLWGLIPGWATPDRKPAPIVNGRAETVSEKPVFRHAFRRGRCIVPADGFYEWRTEGSRKQPYFFRFRDDRPFAFAALWDEWRPKPDEPVRTLCLLTTDANPLLATIHDRMPVILDEEGAARWLEAPGEDSTATLTSVLRPFPSDEMDGGPVSLWVNKVEHEGPRCLESPEGGDPEQLPLF